MPGNLASRVTVAVAPGAMSAVVDVRRGAPLTHLQLEEALAAAGVTHGIDTRARTTIVAALSRSDTELRGVIVARGTDPVAGSEGGFEPAFEPALRPGRELEDGHFDFHQRDLLKLVDAGDRLGRVRPPTLGAPGVTVSGAGVPASAGRPSSVSLGPGVELLPSGEVRAARAGAIAYRPGFSIDVSDVYDHADDVDLASGSLCLEGSIRVRGSVASNLGVNATGDVTVGGSVDGGAVRAGGNVHVGQSVRGASALVSADGDAVARRAEFATLRCGGTLRVAEALGCELSARRVEVTRLVRGGRAAAEEAVVVRDAGAEDGTATALVAGEPLSRSSDEVIAAVSRAKVSRSFARGRSVRPVSRGARDKGGKTGRAKAVLSTGVLSGAVATAARREALARAAFVEVAGAALPGVRIQIGRVKLELDEAMRAVRFTLDADGSQLTWEGSRR